MSAMEKSLRRALESGDASDPAFRESIYSASERALERMLAQKAVSEDAAFAQRTRLAETINRVEDEFYERQTDEGMASEGPAQHDPELSLDPAYADAHAYSTHGADEQGGARHVEDGEEEFQLRPVFGGAGDAAPSSPVAMAVSTSGRDAAPQSASAPVRPSSRTRGDTRGEEAARRAVTRGNAQSRRVLLIFLVVAAVLAIGGYVVYAGSGGASTSGADAGWIGLFDGRRLDALATPNGGRMESQGGADEESEPSVRFTSAGETSGMEVAVGPGVVSGIGGRQVMVEIVAGSPDGGARTFAVECRLGGVSVCGRRVFTTTRPSETFAFRMDVPSDAGAGSIGIASVPGAAGESLDLYSMRLKNV